MCAHICIYVYTCTHTCAYVYMCMFMYMFTHICAHYVICFIYVCVYTHGVIQTWRRNHILYIMMSEAAAHTYAWIICLNVHGLTHPQIHPHTPTNSYKGIYMQASAQAHSPIHIYHTHFVVLKFYCSSIPISHKTYYLFVTLYSQAIFKYFITVCIFNITNQVVNKS